MSVRVSVRPCAQLWHPSPFVSTMWCSRPYKPYIFWKLIIWWWQWPRRRLTKRQIQRQGQSASKTQCMLSFFSKQGVQGFKILYFHNLYYYVYIFLMWIFPSEDSHSLLGLVLPVFLMNKVLQYIVSTWSPWRAHALQAWTLLDLGSSYSFQSRSETFFWRRWTMSEYILLVSIVSSFFC